MKCVCGTEAKKIKTELELFDGTLLVRDVDAYYCPSCKEELFTSEQGGKIQEKLKGIVPIESFRVRKRVAKVGNSYMIPISKDVAEFMHLKKDTEVRLVVKDRRRLIIDVE